MGYIDLKPCQSAAIRSCVAALSKEGKALLVGPTGSGKTIMASVIIERLLGSTALARVLVLQHRVELMDQNAAALARMPRLSRKGLAMFGGGRRRGRPRFDDIVVAMVDTAAGTLLPNLGEFDLLWIDEAHHAASATYRRVVMDLVDRNPSMMVLGTTATPERADGGDLAWLFGDRPAHVIQLETAIAEGLVMHPRVEALNKTETLALPDVAAEVQAALSEMPDDCGGSALPNLRVVNDAVVAKWLEYAAGRRTVMYCSTIDGAEALAAAFCAAGVDAVAVSSLTGMRKRKQITDDLEADRGARVVCNSMLLTEGFDAKPIACVGLLRGFASRPLMIQVIGRALRMMDGKPQPLVLDFVDAVLRHDGLRARIRLEGEREQAAKRELESEAGGARALERIDVSDCVLTEVDPGIGGAGPAGGGESGGGCGGEAVETLEIISRAEAMALGLPKYFTGKPCKHGHVAERFIKGSCVKCSMYKRKKTVRNKPGKTIMSRENARKFGLKLYFDGTRCRAGHWDDRFTSTGACVVCQKAKYHARNLHRRIPEKQRKQRGPKLSVSFLDIKVRVASKYYMKKCKDKKVANLNVYNSVEKFKRKYGELVYEKADGRSIRNVSTGRIGAQGELRVERAGEAA